MSDNSTALVIDDEPQIRKLLRVLLEQEHYRTLESESGRHGLSEAALRRPDVVLLDLGLPDMDGLAVLERVKARAEGIAVRQGASGTRVTVRPSGPCYPGAAPRSRNR